MIQDTTKKRLMGEQAKEGCNITVSRKRRLCRVTLRPIFLEITMEWEAQHQRKSYRL